MEKNKIYENLLQPDQIQEYLGSYFKLEQRDLSSDPLTKPKLKMNKEDAESKKKKILTQEEMNQYKDTQYIKRSSQKKYQKMRVQNLFKYVDQDSISLKLQGLYLVGFEKEKKEKMEIQTKKIEKEFAGEKFLKRFHEKKKAENTIYDDYMRIHHPKKPVQTAFGAQKEIYNKVERENKRKAMRGDRSSSLDRSNSNDKSQKNEQARSASPLMNVQEEFQMMKDAAIKLPQGDELQRSMHMIYDGEPKSYNNYFTPGLVAERMKNNSVLSLKNYKNN